MNKMAEALKDFKVADTIEHLGEPYEIQVDLITPNPNQPRKFFDEDKLNALADSIYEQGQETPISVIRNENKSIPFKFIILDGERRWRAVNIIQTRLSSKQTIKAFLSRVTNPKEFFRRSVIANLHREDLTELEEAAAIVKLLEDGMTQQQIASLLNKSSSYVFNRTKLHSLPDEVKEMLHPSLPRNSRLTATAATDIALSTKDPELRIELAREAVRRQLNIMDTRQLIARHTGGVIDYGLPTADAIQSRVGTQSKKSDYRKFVSLLGHSRRGVSHMLNKVDIEAMYYDREDGEADRKFDANKINNLIVDLQQLLTKVRG